MQKHTTATRTTYLWRFLALSCINIDAKPCRLSIEATSEWEARSLLAGRFVLIFAGRLPVREVVNA